MVQRFVESSRLSRAEEISDSKVKLEILRRDPLSVYCTIQGSGKEPYIVLIDLKEGIVGHACPDFSRAPPARRYQGQAIGWCKHLGKLLLMLDKSDVDAIYQVVESLRVVKSGKKLPEILEHIKEQATKIDDKEKISLKDQIAQEKETPASDGKLAERIQQELIQHNIADSLIRMERLVDEVKDKYDELQPILFDEYKLLRKRFLDEFWTTTLIKRLEIAALLVRISSLLGRKEGETPSYIASKLQKPESPEVHEITDAAIVLQFLEIEPNKILGPLDKEVYNKRLKVLAYRLRISGSITPEVRKWSDNNIMIQSKSVHIKPTIDDFLIYVLKASQENQDFDIRQYSQGNMFLIPPEVETRLGLNYVINRISTSERGILTEKEVAAHPKLFDWLRGSTVKTEWTERTRIRTPDTILFRDGFIVQWDVCAHGLFNEFLHAYDGINRVVIDKSSSLLSSVQPFDMTLCYNSVRRGKTWELIVKPAAILTPDQVINLVSSGVRIVSDILPWNTLHKFATEGYIKSGEVSLARAHCQERPFVYGCLDLDKELAVIEDLGAGGIAQDVYEKQLKAIQLDTGRLNPHSRAIVRTIMGAEGHQLQALLDLVGDADAQIKLVHSVMKKTKGLDEFRETIVEESIQQILEGKIVPGSLLHYFEMGRLRHYSHVSDVLNDKVKVLVSKLGKEISRPTTAATLKKNPIGRMILDELSISKTGKLTANDVKGITHVLTRLERAVARS